ncbi:MAG: hypothetical protein JST79_13585 [Acidobacteria bacterium]|nr:hypothetical protein [Acidobacteriota bacterium]
MTPRIQLIYYALWIAHPVLQAAVAGVMVWRKLHRLFPVFFAYLAFEVFVFGLTFTAYHTDNYPFYFYSYWICAVVSLVIGFKVIHEIFLDIFRPYHALKDLGSILFKWAALVMLLVAGVVAAASTVVSAGPLIQAIITVQRCVRVIQVGLILFLLVFPRYLGISWRQHSFGIALGFGSFAGVELIAVALRASVHVQATTADLSNMIAYNASILIWLFYMVTESAVRKVDSTLLMSQRWDHSLGEIRRPHPEDSLIPMFEGMVERAFSRSNEGDNLPDLPLPRKPTAHEPAPPPAVPSAKSAKAK